MQERGAGAGFANSPSPKHSYVTSVTTKAQRGRPVGNATAYPLHAGLLRTVTKLLPKERRRRHDMSSPKPVKSSKSSLKERQPASSTRSSRTHGIWNDQQIPYHDPRAFSVAVQIFADAKINRLIYNGDWGDYQSLGTHAKGDRDDLYKSIKYELKDQQYCLQEAQKAIKPDEADWSDGNHEWRVQRAFWHDPKLAAKVLDIEYTKLQTVGSVKEALSIPVLLGLRDLGIRYAGTYPKGVWLLPGGADNQRNVYVHHGFTARKKSGFTVSGQMDDHWCSQVVGHCERLAGPIWTRKLGRDFFGIENGNLSLIGEPEKGDGIYAGVPFSDSKLLNHRQGITIIYEEAGELWPFTIRIRDGKAHFNGKLYRA